MLHTALLQLRFYLCGSVARSWLCSWADVPTGQRGAPPSCVRHPLTPSPTKPAQQAACRAACQDEGTQLKIVQKLWNQGIHLDTKEATFFLPGIACNQCLQSEREKEITQSRAPTTLLCSGGTSLSVISRETQPLNQVLSITQHEYPVYFYFLRLPFRYPVNNFTM